MVRIEATAEASLADMFERIKLGIAMAAMIKMIATTISNSISEKPFCLPRIGSILLGFSLDFRCTTDVRITCIAEAIIIAIPMEISHHNENRHLILFEAPPPPRNLPPEEGQPWPIMTIIGLGD